VQEASQPTGPHGSGSQPTMNTEPVQGPSRHIAKVVYHNSHPERPFKIQKMASSNATKTVPETIVTDFYDSLPASQIDSGLGPDVFEDLDDHVLAAITDQMFEAAENKFKTVNDVKSLKQQKVKTLGLQKSIKPKNSRKSSRLMKLKTQAIEGDGSSIDQPMVIEESEEGTLTQENDDVLQSGTCMNVLRGLPKLVMRGSNPV
jgi:hypothetical protein